MADEFYIPDANPTVKQILGSDNIIYDIVDQGARDLIAALGSPMHYVGELSSTDTHYNDDWDGATYNPIILVNGQSTKSYTAVSGDIFTKQTREYVFDGTKWHKFGDVEDLGAFAYADTGSVTIKPKGTNAASTVTFSGGTTDVVLGEATTFTASAPTIEHGTPSKDAVLGEDTTFTNSTSSVSFGTHTTASVFKSTVTATVPKQVAGTAKYMAASASGTATSNSKLVQTNVPNVTSVGSASVVPSFSANVNSSGVLSFSWNAGSASVPPTLGTDITVATGTLASNGTGASVATGIGTQPTVSLSGESSTATGRVKYIDSVTTSGTDAVTFASGHTVNAITALGAATAAAQTISVGDNDIVNAVTGMPTSTASTPTITVGTNDKVTAIKTLGTATAAAQKFTGTQETYTVTPVS